MRLATNEKNPKLGIAVFMFLFMALFAICGAMLGNLMPQLIKAYKLELSQAGLISLFQGFGGILSLLIGGIVADGVKKLHLIIFAFLTYGIVLCVISLKPVFIIFLLLFFLLGVFGSLLNMVITSYLSDLFPEKRGFYVNLAHTFFGVGSIIGPIYTTTMTNSGFNWNKDFQYQGMLITCISLILIVLTVMRFGHHSTDHAAARKGKPYAEYLNIITDRRIIILCLASFVFMGYQSSVMMWLPTYLTDSLHYYISFAGLIMTVFWIGIAAGRAPVAFLSLKIDYRRYLTYACLSGAIIFIAAILINHPAVWIIAAACLGLTTGPGFPILLVLACEIYPGNSAAATSVLCLCTSLAAMLFPWLMGVTAQGFSFGAAILIPFVNLILASAVLAGGAGRKATETKESKMII